MERGYQRHSDWYNHKFSTESVVSMGDIRITAHSATIDCSALGSVHIDRGGQEVHSKNIFQTKK